MCMEIMKNKLRKYLDKERYIHSIEVMRLSVELAERYGEDANKAAVAGLLHDCAKCIPDDKMLDMCVEYNADIDGIMLVEKALIHGPLGERMASHIFDIHDFDVLMAIKYHSTGRKDMTLLEKIIYIADYIEPGRSFEGIDKIRDMVEINLDKAILMAVDNTIEYILSKGALIHPYTIDARNDILRFSMIQDKNMPNPW